MTTDEDRLRDHCITAATQLCLAMGLRHGIDQVAQAMTEAGMAEAKHIIAHGPINSRQADMLEAT